MTTEADPSAPLRRPWVVVIAASAGGIDVTRTVLRALPHGLPAAVIVVLHRPATGESSLESILMRAAHMPIVTAGAGDFVGPGLFMWPVPIAISS